MRTLTIFLLGAWIALAGVRGEEAAAADSPLPLAELARLAPDAIHSGLPATSDPSQTFDLYLPPGFTPERTWPLLLVFDPRSRGRFAADIFVPAAREHGWVVASSNNTRSDGPFEPNVRAVNAIWPDLMRRLPIDPRRVYASGFSGGAILSWLIGQRGDQLAGIVPVGGRPPDGFEKAPLRCAAWIAAGTVDFNFLPSLELEAAAAASGVAHRFEPFEGPHAWFSSDEARRAVTWLEVLAMRDGRRPRDERVIDAALAADLAAAEADLAAGDPLGAARRFSAVAATYAGLREVAAAGERGAELLRGAPARAALKERKWVARYEEQGRRRIAETLALLAETEPVAPVGKLRAALGLDGLLGQARESGERGRAAQRVLASVAAQLGFYQMRELFAAGDFPKAVVALALAAEARPGDPYLRYNLACAQARAGMRGEALTSLEQAVAEGLARPEQMASDPDLASLRSEARFLALLERVHAKAAPR